MQEHIVITLNTVNGQTDMGIEFPETMKPFEAMHVCHMAGDIIRQKIMERTQVAAKGNIIIPQFAGVNKIK